MYRKIFFVWMAFVLCGASWAQQRKVQNKPYIDERKFHYGFFIGVHDQGVHLTNNGRIDSESGAQWVAENDGQNFGFSVGILGDWKLSKWASFRLTPGLHFGSKHIKFRNLADGETKTQDMKNCLIAIPCAMKWTAPRFNNYRPYVLTGIAPMYDLLTNKHSLLRMKPLTMNLEVGFGCDCYLPYFKFIPELKFSFGLSNILNKKRSDLTDSKQRIYTDALDKASMNMVTLTFYFE